MKFWTLLTALPLTLTLASFGCDSEPETEVLDEEIALAADADAPLHAGEHMHKHKRMSTDDLCAIVSCSDAPFA